MSMIEVFFEDGGDNSPWTGCNQHKHLGTSYQSWGMWCTRTQHSRNTQLRLHLHTSHTAARSRPNLFNPFSHIWRKPRQNTISQNLCPDKYWHFIEVEWLTYADFKNCCKNSGQCVESIKQIVVLRDRARVPQPPTNKQTGHQMSR